MTNSYSLATFLRCINHWPGIIKLPLKWMCLKITLWFHKLWVSRGWACVTNPLPTTCQVEEVYVHSMSWLPCSGIGPWCFFSPLCFFFDSWKLDVKTERSPCSFASRVSDVYTPGLWGHWTKKNSGLVDEDHLQMPVRVRKYEIVLFLMNYLIRVFKKPSSFEISTF